MGKKLRHREINLFVQDHTTSNGAVSVQIEIALNTTSPDMFLSRSTGKALNVKHNLDLLYCFVKNLLLNCGLLGNNMLMLGGKTAFLPTGLALGGLQIN